LTPSELADFRPLAQELGYPLDEALDGQQGDEPDLLLSIYIPNERLYAAEQRRILALFRDWLAKTSKQGIRQVEHRTSRGAKFEFFADGSVSLSELRAEIDVFTYILNLCVDSPAAAHDALSQAGMSEATATELVTEFRREARRVHKDTRQARENRMLSLKQDLEDKAFKMGIDLQSHPGTQLAARLDAMLEELIPRPDAASLQALASPQPTHFTPNPSITINLNPKFYSAMEQFVADNVNGDLNIGPDARQILALIKDIAGPAAQPLSTAIHELEDPDTPLADRKAAISKLKKFLADLGSKVEDTALTLLEKYLESKMGI
jgi:hypothetical protein